MQPLKNLFNLPQIQGKVFEDPVGVAKVFEDDVDSLPKFKNCHFKKGFTLIGPDTISCKVLLENCVVDNALQMYGNHFYEEVLLSHCKIEKLEIMASSFKTKVFIKECEITGRLEIVDSVFHQLVQIKKSSFLGGANIFSKYDSFGAVGFKGGLLLS